MIEIIKSSKEIISLVFLVCASLAFLRILFWGDDENDKWQKIFGGLVILIAALISGNGWAISIAVIIGGLIVASEDFMRFIAAIYRTNPDKVADTVNAFKTKRASDAEVDDKLKEDTKEELEIIPAPDEPTPSTSSERTKERMLRVKRVEELVQAYLQENIKGYEPHVKLVKGSASIVVDGVIRRKSGKIGAVVEIRYITPKSFPILRILINGFYGKLARCDIRKRALVPVVSENLTVDDAKKMNEENKNLASLLFLSLHDEKVERVTID